ncbi:DUF2721 domain-containing protein [Aeoliella mucimassa]|uniref:DUF2721 domain-containing protein n=1 Tax=Aeoliella mucimassa TaxID=2527972 RepID=A0A518ARA6_9BACT|nr:DUF2721 domain-containing protein [Aeoliella mucimassa]QDU57259.1 hypothetical protein Pan181_34740 [Aeoliella mucimassa]
MSLDELIPILNLAVGPVILISGVGLILLSMTNRFGRVIDRSRQLAPLLKSTTGDERQIIVEQLRILWSRAWIVRAGIAMGVLSVLLTAVIVISLFAGALFKLPIVYAIIACFALCLTSIVGCLICFLVDVNLSLHALWHQIPEEARK